MNAPWTVARETSVDLNRAVTAEPAARPSSVTASFVIAAVSSPPSTATRTEAMAEPTVTSRAVPCS